MALNHCGNATRALAKHRFFAEMRDIEKLQDRATFSIPSKVTPR